ncbi:MAG: hypothetical protein WAV32_04195 [Halobacteriota archaeon]
MKKQLAIAIVAILLTAVLLAPTVMAFAVRDGDSEQYPHRGYNSITYNSVTAYNQPYITLSNGIGAWESSSGVKYDFATGIPNCYGLKTSNLALDDSDDLNLTIVGEAPTPVKLETSRLLRNATRLIDDSDDFAVVGEAPRCLLRNVRVNAFDLLNGTKTLLP